MGPKKRYVVVVDRGWIFAGDMTCENGFTYLERALNVGRWTGGQWFSGALANPKKDVTLLKIPTRVEIPDAAVIFRVPVDDEWGL